MSKTFNNTGHNDELGRLYKECKLIRPVEISLIAHTQEFIDALLQHGGPYNDEVVYKILKEEYKAMKSRGYVNRRATDTMNKISKSVTGDSSTWREEVFE